jgi:hypothetical protein
LPPNPSRGRNCNKCSTSPSLGNRHCNYSSQHDSDSEAEEEDLEVKGTKKKKKVKVAIPLKCSH